MSERWSQFHTKYYEEMESLRTIGLEAYKNRTVQTYKLQALKELTMRRYLEEKLTEAQDELNRRQDRIELLEEKLWKLEDHTKKLEKQAYEDWVAANEYKDEDEDLVNGDDQ
jgi:hypothetical protein